MANNYLFLSGCLIVALVAIASARHRTLLTAYIALMGICANLFVLKQIELFGMSATASDVYAIGGILGLNLLREFHDFKACKQAIGISFCCMAFFALMGQLHLMYIPSEFDQSHAAYAAILTPNLRIMLASIAVYFVVQVFDVYFYNYFIRRTFNAIWLRTGFSLVISQGLDTVLFTYIGLYGIISNLDEILLISLSIKLIAIALMTPFTQLSKKIMSI